MIRIYLAGRYSRREELCRYAEQLRELGFIVDARWLEGNHQIDDAGLSVEAKAEERTRFASEDWEDLKKSDWCISFTEAPRSSNSRGGRHVEFGAALAMELKCVVIGPRENVFHCLSRVGVFETWDAFLSHTKSQIERGWYWALREPEECEEDEDDVLDITPGPVS